jgi:hypothetical protein
LKRFLQICPGSGLGVKNGLNAWDRLKTKVIAALAGRFHPLVCSPTGFAFTAMAQLKRGFRRKKWWTVTLKTLDVSEATS